MALAPTLEAMPLGCSNSAMRGTALAHQSPSLVPLPLRSRQGPRAAITPSPRPHQQHDVSNLGARPTQHSESINVAARAFATSSAIGSVITAASAVSIDRRSPPSKEASQDEALAFTESLKDVNVVTEVVVPRAPLPTDKAITVIATDVDGTLLDSQQQMSERTERALRLAMEQGVKVVLATGKARGPWVPEIMERLQLDCPGVFLQGLMVYSADGTVLYERTLEDEVARDVINEAVSRDMTLVAYCGERILCAETNVHTDRLIGYGEPIPEAVGALSDVLGTIPIHKLLFMADDATLAVLRRDLEARLAGRATLVTALHGMLEVLPLGASKANGLQRVLAQLGAHESTVLAAGDGENDTEMLRMVGLSVAMGNASTQLKQEAHYVTESNDQDGLAQAVERFVLKPGFWCWD